MSNKQQFSNFGDQGIPLNAEIRRLRRKLGDKKELLAGLPTDHPNRILWNKQDKRLSNLFHQLDNIIEHATIMITNNLRPKNRNIEDEMASIRVELGQLWDSLQDNK